MARPGRAQGNKKLTITVSEALHAELQKMSEEQGVTIAELFRRAIALEKFLYEHRDGEILFRQDGELRQLVFADRLVA